MTTTLHPPTAEDLAARRWPPRTTHATHADWGIIPAYPTIAELLTVMDGHGIPQSAEIGYPDCGSHELVVTW